jgi:hypothetical protein
MYFNYNIGHERIHRESLVENKSSIEILSYLEKSKKISD